MPHGKCADCCYQNHHTRHGDVNFFIRASALAGTSGKQGEGFLGEGFSVKIPLFGKAQVLMKFCDFRESEGIVAVKFHPGGVVEEIGKRLDLGFLLTGERLHYSLYRRWSVVVKTAVEVAGGSPLSKRRNFSKSGAAGRMMPPPTPLPRASYGLPRGHEVPQATSNPGCEPSSGWKGETGGESTAAIADGAGEIKQPLRSAVGGTIKLAESEGGRLDLIFS
jgi:hypothetical protein